MGGAEQPQYNKYQGSKHKVHDGVTFLQLVEVILDTCVSDSIMLMFRKMELMINPL